MSVSKKVYFFVRTFPVLSQTFVLNQVKDLKSRGMDVHVLAVNPINDDSSVLTSIFGSDAFLNKLWFSFGLINRLEL